jgi:N-acetyl-anhydromuramyl-L-alanine amidase AmpD
MLTRRSKNVFLSLLAAASLVTGPGLAGPGGGEVGTNEAKDVRTFDVAMDGEPGAGTATATVTNETDQFRMFDITRSVRGATSGYTRGTVKLDKHQRTMTVTFDALTSGFTGALSGDSSTTPGPQATIPITKDQYVYTFEWSDGTQHSETWTERSHVNPDITINNPKDVVKSAPSAQTPVLLDASVTDPSGKYDHVEFCIDEKTVATFNQTGHLHKTLPLGPGQHRFVVKAFGAASAGHPEGEYMGEAEQIFVVAGLELTPATGSTVEPTVVAEAMPVALTGVAHVRFFVDGNAVFTARTGPFAAKLTLPRTLHGTYHTISAIAFDSQWVRVAQASSKVTVATADPSTPHPIQTAAADAKDEPSIKGKPSISQFPADPKNYSHGRSHKISMIVMHKTEGPSVESAVNWFHNPAAHAAAHYCLDDTQIVQTVGDDNVAWHAGNNSINQISIGIEVAGFIEQPVKNDEVYENAAKLVAWLCHKYGITPSTSTIIGHADVPDPDHPGRFGGANNHQDPGGHPNNPAHWDWDKFMGMVQQAYSAN